VKNFKWVFLNFEDSANCSRQEIFLEKLNWKTATLEDCYSDLNFIFDNDTSMFLRFVFYELWRAGAKSSWNDTTQDAVKLVELQSIKTITLYWMKAKKVKVESGDSLNWDIPILCNLIEGIVQQFTHLKQKHVDFFNLQTTIIRTLQISGN